MTALLATHSPSVAAGLIVGAAVVALMLRSRDRRVARLRSRDDLSAVAGWLEDVTGVLRDTGDRPWSAGVLAQEVRDLYRRHEVPDQADTTALRAVVAVNEIVDALEAAQVYRRVVEAGGDVVVRLDDLGRVVYASSGLTRALGWPVEALLGRPVAGIVHAGDIDTFAAVTAGSASRRVRVRASSGAWHVVEWTAAVPDDGDPTAGGPRRDVVLVGHDVTSSLAVEERLLNQALRDELTGLPNRKAILALADQTLPGATEDRPLSVIMVDLDRFKEINDSLGHATGDELLAQVGPRLRESLRPSDIIARLGGDDFAVLLPEADVEQARRVCERLAEALEAPFFVADLELHVEASFGIAVSHGGPGLERSVEATEDLMREADIAMYRAKDNGIGIAVFDPHLDSGQTRSRLALSSQLRRGIGEGQLVVHYQPVVDVLDGVLESVEALVRWQHPHRGLVPPGEFLPIAEQSGLIIPMSKVVLDSAVAQVARWAREGLALQVAVNMSPRWLQHADVPDIVARTLEEHGVAPSQLRLEITESVVLVDPEGALATLNRLRDMGIGLSLDDFGTGYSSMTHLRHLPVDQLKVDKAFVQAMTTSPQDAVIVRAAVELGHNLGLDVIAEGIEDADTLAEVVASGCSRAQGYYFARPMPASELTTWAKERFPAQRMSAGASPGASQGESQDTSSGMADANR